MSLHINTINEQTILQKTKEKHFATLEKAAATEKEDSIKESAKNKKCWVLIISIIVVLMIVACFIGSASYKAFGAAGMFLATFLPVFILASGVLFLLERPIKSNKAINESYETDLQTIHALKAEKTTSDLLLSAQKTKSKAGLYSYLNDLLFDLIYDLETLQMYCNLLNNNILNYKYDDGLYVTYADRDGIVHQDVNVRCGAQYNINTKEDTLSFIEDETSYRILLTRPYPNKQES